jgi:Flp pilus assembly protein TadG
MTRLRILRRLAARDGQALIEFILVLPMLFLLILNLVNFAGFFYAWITVANAARAGADYAILSISSVGGGITPATAAGTVNVVTNDMSSLPNNTSLVINICQNNNGTFTSLYGTGICSSSTVASDPEPTSYVLTSVDVSYTYKPFIAAFSFPNLGVHLTIPPTAIRRVSAMRSLQ